MKLLVKYLTSTDEKVKTQKLKRLVLKRKNSCQSKSRKKFDPTWSWWWMVNKVKRMCQDNATAQATNQRKMFTCVICQEEHVNTFLENQSLEPLHERQSDTLCDICYTLLKFKVTSKVRKHKILQIENLANQSSISRAIRDRNANLDRRNNNSFSGRSTRLSRKLSKSSSNISEFELSYDFFLNFFFLFFF